MILKGQNLRVMTLNGNVAKCVAMATNCTITLTNNTEDASHKDITEMAQLPVVTSNTWSVSVDSFDMSDTAVLLRAIKNHTVFTLMWDQTSTTDNQQTDGASYARKGTAYLTDATFTFNDRENSTKTIQFTGHTAIETMSADPNISLVTENSFTKGQTVRLFLSSDNTAAASKVIAAAKSLSLHVSVQTESASTKDTTGNFQIMEPTSLSYDISTSAMVQSDEVITSSVDGMDAHDLELIYANGTPVKWVIANVSGANNRTKGAQICAGSAVLTQLTISASNRQNATYDAQLTGYGPYQA